MTETRRTLYHLLRQTLDATGDAPGATTSQAASLATRAATFELVAMNVEASSAENAVRAYAEKQAAASDMFAGGTFVAVPASSWNPRTVETERKTLVKVG